MPGNKIDPVLAWKHVERLLRDDHVAQGDDPGDEEIERQMRAAGIRPKRIPSADEIMAHAARRARERGLEGIVPLRVVPMPAPAKRHTWACLLYTSTSFALAARSFASAASRRATSVSRTALAALATASSARAFTDASLRVFSSPSVSLMALRSAFSFSSRIWIAITNTADIAATTPNVSRHLSYDAMARTSVALSTDCLLYTSRCV